MQRIRPAIDVLKQWLPIEHVLASDRLMTDGVEILLTLQSDEDDDERLVVVRNNQAVFREAVVDYLRAITFDGGHATSLLRPRYREPGLNVVVSPKINGGSPTMVGRGIKVADVTSRLRAEGAVADGADDFELSETDVLELEKLAA